MSHLWQSLTARGAQEKAQGWIEAHACDVQVIQNVLLCNPVGPVAEWVPTNETMLLEWQEESLFFSAYITKSFSGVYKSGKKGEIATFHQKCHFLKIVALFPKTWAEANLLLTEQRW